MSNQNSKDMFNEQSGFGDRRFRQIRSLQRPKPYDAGLRSFSLRQEQGGQLARCSWPVSNNLRGGSTFHD